MAPALPPTVSSWDETTELPTGLLRVGHMHPEANTVRWRRRPVVLEGHYGGVPCPVLRRSVGGWALS